MERTELIITLTGVGLAVVLFLFYCVFESCIKFFQDRRNPEDARIQRAGEAKDYVQLGQFQNTISFGRRKNPQMKHLLNDPYRLITE